MLDRNIVTLYADILTIIYMILDEVFKLIMIYAF